MPQSRHSMGYAFRLIPVAALMAVSATAARAESFYANKTMTLLVGSSVASGFAAYARLIAPYLKKYIPGNPAVIVKTMTGAGGGTAALHVLQIAPKDGTLIATLTPNALMDKAFGRRSQIDPLQYQYIGGAQRAVRICVVAGTAPATTFAQAQQTRLLMGSTQPGSLTTDYVNMLVRAAGAKFRVVLGYKGPGTMYLAAERGETHGICGVEWSAFLSSKGDLFRSGKLKVIMQIGSQPVAEMTKLGIPSLWQFIKSKEDEAAILLMVNFQEMLGKVFVAPPGVPADRIAELRKAFAAALKDPELLAQAKKMKLTVDLISADEAAKAVRDLYTAAPELMRRLKTLVSDVK